MICKHCQAELEDGSAFCHICGMSLEEDERQEVVTEEETEEAPEAAENAEEIAQEAADAGEAAAEKPGKRENLLVRITAIVGCVVVLVALVGGIFAAVGGNPLRKNDLLGNACYSVSDRAAVAGADTVVATIGDAKLTNVQLQIFYWDQVYDFLDQFYNYMSYLGLDYTKPLHEQTTGDGSSTWEQYFLQNALDAWHQYQSLALEAEKEGFVLPDSMQEFLDTLPETLLAAAADNVYANVDDMVAEEYGPGTTAEAYKAYMRLYYTTIAYFESCYAELEATEAEINAYFEANASTLQTNYGVTKDSGKLIDVRHILVCPEGGTTDESGNTTYSEAEWKACEKKAQDLLDEFLAGEATESAFAQMAVEHTEDSGSQSTGGLYEMVYAGQMVTEFNDWCFDETRQAGDTGLVRSPYGYHIMYFVYGEEGWIRYSTEGVLSEKGAQLLEEVVAAHPMEVNYKKIGIGQIDLG